MKKNQSDSGNPTKRSRKLLSPESPPQLQKKLIMSSPPEQLAILAEMRAMNGNINSLRNEMASEMVALNTKFDAAFSNWEKEKAQFLTKQSELEARLDRMERQGKRNNVVITGLDELGPDKVKSAVSDLFTNKLGVNVPFNDSFQIKLRTGKTKVIVKFNSSDEKRLIMMAKKSLPKDVYIDDDLISNDQFLRFKAREFVKGIRKDGMNIRIRTGTVIIDGKVYTWEQSSQTFVMRKN